MGRPLDIRRTLLAAVDAFLDASPASLAKAHHLVVRCESACRFFTLDDVVWGGMIHALTDSVCYDHPPTLRAYRSLLAGGSREISRHYLNYDFAWVFTPEERAWLDTLHGMLDFLSGYPFPDTDAAIQAYKRRVEEIQRLMLQSPPPQRLEDETIYHLILRDVSTILINIDLRYSLLRSTHLVPETPYASSPPQPNEGRDTTPDVSGTWTGHAARCAQSSSRDGSCSRGKLPRSTTISRFTDRTWEPLRRRRTSETQRQVRRDAVDLPIAFIIGISAQHDDPLMASIR